MRLGGKTLLVVVLNMKMDRLCMGLGGLVLGSSYFVEEFFGPQKQKQRLCSALLAGIFGCSPLMVHQAQFRVFGGGFWGGLKLSSAS